MSFAMDLSSSVSLRNDCKSTEGRVDTVVDVEVVRDEISESFLAAIDTTNAKNGRIRRILELLKSRETHSSIL